MDCKNKLKVLIAIDGSDDANCAVEWYVEEVHQKKDDVTFLYVSPYHKPASTDADLVITQIKLERRIKEWEENIKNIRQKVFDILESHHQVNQLGSFRFFHAVGDGGQQLCKVAMEQHINLIVMGSRGIGTHRRTILGSVSHYVLHHAHCPVTICRKEFPSQT